ncbi:hypothetical protein CCP3SC15_90042 [Gammaproteobacteria bacterium]
MNTIRIFSFVFPSSAGTGAPSVRTETELSFWIKGHARLGVAAAVALATLTGCNTFATRPAAPVEDHSVKVPPPVMVPESSRLPSSHATGKSIPTSTAQTAPLPSLLEEAPLRAEPLPPQPSSRMPGSSAWPPPALAPTPIEVPPPAVGRTDLPAMPVSPPAYPASRSSALPPERGQRPSQRVVTPPPAATTVSGVSTTPTPPTPVQPEIQSPASRPTASSSNTGVVALLGKADDQAAAGQIDSAAVTLERALRIEPENGRLWHELAGIRLKQGQLDAAISVAEKSNSLARNQRDLQARNWRLIAVARQKQGQSQAAAEALLRARSLEGR